MNESVTSGAIHTDAVETYKSPPMQIEYFNSRNRVLLPVRIQPGYTRLVADYANER